MNWLLENYIEIIGAVTGLIFVVLEIMENKWLWPVGIISAGFYIVVFYDKKIYADMSLQVYFLVMSIYGWFYWTRAKKSNNSEKMPIKKSDFRTILIFFPATILIFFVIYLILTKFTDSPVPLVDSITTALSITATFMLARKILEQWALWILVNGLSIGLYIYRDLYPTAGLYFVFLVLAVIGYIRWYKTLKKQTT